MNKLKKENILFIDSSHVLKIGSDVQYEYLEIFPKLNKGVIVHMHDIFLPAEYRKEWILTQSEREIQDIYVVDGSPGTSIVKRLQAFSSPQGESHAIYCVEGVTI